MLSILSCSTRLAHRTIDKSAIATTLAVAGYFALRLKPGDLPLEDLNYEVTPSGVGATYSSGVGSVLTKPTLSIPLSLPLDTTLNTFLDDDGGQKNDSSSSSRYNGRNSYKPEETTTIRYEAVGVRVRTRSDNVLDGNSLGAELQIRHRAIPNPDAAGSFPPWVILGICIEPAANGTATANSNANTSRAALVVSKLLEQWQVVIDSMEAAVEDGLEESNEDVDLATVEATSTAPSVVGVVSRGEDQDFINGPIRNLAAAATATPENGSFGVGNSLYDLFLDTELGHVTRQSFYTYDGWLPCYDVDVDANHPKINLAPWSTHVPVHWIIVREPLLVSDDHYRLLVRQSVITHRPNTTVKNATSTTVTTEAVQNFCSVFQHQGDVDVDDDPEETSKAQTSNWLSRLDTTAPLCSNMAIAVVVLSSWIQIFF